MLWCPDQAVHGNGWGKDGGGASLMLWVRSAIWSPTRAGRRF